MMSRTPPRTPGTRPRRSGRRAAFASSMVAVLLGAALLLSPATVPDASASQVVWFHGDHLTLEELRIQVDAAETFARTHLSFTIANPSNTTHEGRFHIPLPPDATLTGFTLRTNETTLVGTVQERATARQQYDDATERGEDAVLLETADDTRVRLSLNVPADSERVLNITYLQPVALESGARTYRLDLSPLGQIPVPLGPVHVQVRIESKSGLAAVQVPAMPLDPRQLDAHRYHGVGTVEGGPYEDLVLLWSEGQGAWRPTLVSSILPGLPGSENATLIASLTPPDAQGSGLPRDIVFVLDTSGSMSGQKIEQARESLREVLLTLRPDDRFGLVTFDNDVHRLTPGLRVVNDANVQEARRLLDDVEAAGGTNFEGGLLDGLGLLHTANDMERVPLLVMLSDGMPTAGITDHRLIIQNMQQANTRGVAVHLLAIGLDADDTFLEDVAAKSGGSLTHLAPNEDLKTRLNGFYASLEDPLVTNLRITIHGQDVRDRYPTALPALYQGDTLRLAFRADLSSLGPVEIHLDGTSADGPVSERFRFEVQNITTLAEADRLWGAMHVASLLSRERTEGTRESLRNETIQAAITYGIVTPYTSWVIVDTRPADPLTTHGAADGTATRLKIVPEGTGTPTRSAYSGDDQGSPPDTALHGDRDEGDGDDGTGRADDDAEATPGPAALLVLLALAVMLGVLRRRT